MRVFVEQKVKIVGAIKIPRTLRMRKLIHIVLSTLLINLLIDTRIYSQIPGEEKYLVVHGVTDPFADIALERYSNKQPSPLTKSSADGKFSCKFFFPVSADTSIAAIGPQTYGLFISKPPKQKGVITVKIPNQKHVYFHSKEYEIEGEINIPLKEKDSGYKHSNNPWLDAYPLGYIEWDTLKQVFVYRKWHIPFKLGEKFMLKNTFFEPNKSKILSTSFDDIKKLVEYLNNNKNTTIELSGYTDNTGVEKNNKKLSEARAKAVADCLILKGIDKSRVKYKGYGSANPIASNDTEESRWQNRRVECVIKSK